MANADRDPVSQEDLAAIGLRIVEMVDRVRVADKCLPGTEAKWRLDIDGVAYDVVVTVRHDG